MNKIPTLTVSILVMACCHARAQQSSPQQARPVEASINSPSAMLQFLFPSYKPGQAMPMAARKMQAPQNSGDAKLVSAQSATEAAQKNNPNLAVKPLPTTVPSQGQQPSTTYIPSAPKK
ncbi:hypothetical protein [Chitinophaga caseinilytica]|uniref:Lipoprotein n=1 Tax=Chitinophaga caseinilytica TaxID=2267521 RepID=A0ABZ2Z3G3_9BACT